MRNTNHYSCNHRQPAYPNAADASYFTEKALEILTAIASGLCVSAAMLFLMVLA